MSEIELRDGTYMTDLLRSKERGIAEMINVAREQTRCAQMKRMADQTTRGKPYGVGDLVRVKLDTYEVGKKLARKYSGKYRVIEVLGGGWTYKLTPQGWKGRDKVRHFNELKDAGRQTAMLDEETESDDEVQRQEIEEVIYSGNLDVAPTKKDIISRSDQSEQVKEFVLEEVSEQPTLRRSKREKRPPQRLQLDLGKTKWYSETGAECKVQSSSSETSFDGGEGEYPSDC